ncbi:MAG: hypothetical protein WC212_01160 [Candidatus Delongbacteria bacterium]|jgi:hypothetical protein
MNKSKKILIITHPGFLNTIVKIIKKLDSGDIKVISFNDHIWRGRTLFQRANLLKDYHCVHFFWGKVKIIDFLIFRFYSKVKIIDHFMGTDLYNILKSKRKTFELKLCSKLSKILVVGYILNEELNSIGVDNEIVYIINHEVKKTDYNFPLDKKAIVYIPSARKIFFNYDMLFRLAEENMDTEFTWFPYEKEENEILPENVTTFKYINNLEIQNKFIENKVFIRIPVHDGGAPLSLIEALNVGRLCIWSFKMEGSETIQNYEELKYKFTSLISKTEPNKKGEDYVISEFNFEKIINGFKQIYSDLGLL